MTPNFPTTLKPFNQIQVANMSQNFKQHLSFHGTHAQLCYVGTSEQNGVAEMGKMEKEILFSSTL